MVEHAAAKGITLLAITDHDTLGGVAEATAAAETHGLRLIPAVEISTQFEKRGVHLLAYFRDWETIPDDFREFLDVRREAREVRLVKIAEALDRCGVKLDLEGVRARADGAVGRPHVARQLLDQGVVSSMQEAFTRFLGRDRPAYVSSNEPSTEDVVRRVKAAHGVSSVAHPTTSDLGRPHFRTLRAAGLHGIEVIHGSAGGALRRRYRKMAKELGLLKTGGSDWHGVGAEGLLGGVRPERCIPMQWRREFEQALEDAAG
jgi:predicted metal-dependent phosphoesterase TrpH